MRIHFDASKRVEESIIIVITIISNNSSSISNDCSGNTVNRRIKKTTNEQNKKFVAQTNNMCSNSIPFIEFIIVIKSVVFSELSRVLSERWYLTLCSFYFVFVTIWSSWVAELLKLWNLVMTQKPSAHICCHRKLFFQHIFYFLFAHQAAVNLEPILISYHHSIPFANLFQMFYEFNK